MSSISWVSCTVSSTSMSWLSWMKFDELAKLRMSSMSWVNCTVSSMSSIS